MNTPARICRCGRTLRSRGRFSQWAPVRSQPFLRSAACIIPTNEPQPKRAGDIRLQIRGASLARLAAWPDRIRSQRSAWTPDTRSNRLTTLGRDAIRCRLTRIHGVSDRDRPRCTFSAMLELWFEEVRERLRIGHSKSCYIVPTRCRFEMSIRAECDELHGALVQRYVPKRVVEYRCAVERLS
jgi:hypothetical protein